MLYPDEDGVQKFVASQARNTFKAFSLYLFESWGLQRRRGDTQEKQVFPALSHIYRISSGDGQSQLEDYIKKAREEPISHQLFPNDIC